MNVLDSVSECETLVSLEVSLLDFFPILCCFISFFIIIIPCVYTLPLSPQHERQHILRVSMTCILVQPCISFCLSCSVFWFRDRWNDYIPPACFSLHCLHSVLLPPSLQLWRNHFGMLKINISLMFA